MRTQIREAQGTLAERKGFRGMGSPVQVRVSVVRCRAGWCQAEEGHWRELLLGVPPARLPPLAEVPACEGPRGRQRRRQR
eukprot:1148798-Pyramimonas_sp.AAC.1